MSLGTNFAVFLLKLGAYKMTGSASTYRIVHDHYLNASLTVYFNIPSYKIFPCVLLTTPGMLGECIHSLVDCVNQLLLGYGLIYSMKRPHSDHPYGFTKARYTL